MMDPCSYMQFGVKELVYVGVPTFLICGLCLYLSDKSEQIVRWLNDDYVPTAEDEQKVLNKIEQEKSELELG